MSEFTANATLNGQELTDLWVVNPGGFFGRTWLLEIGGSNWPLFVIVEADCVWSAIEELAEDETFGFHIRVADANLDDYPEDERHYGPSGQVLDLDHLLIHGDERSDSPFPCRYFGSGLPLEGIEPSEIWEYDTEDAA